jgi:CRP/FNR family cyclic AMP-dependent transcriptional regulator
VNAQQTLSQVPLFRTLEPKYIQRLQRAARERSYAAGDVILTEGEQGIAFYVVMSGHVEATRGDGTVVNRIGPGGSFGELALLNETPRTATVTALDAVTCLVLPRLDFLDALRDQPEIAVQLLKTLAELLRRAEARADQAQAGKR